MLINWNNLILKTGPSKLWVTKTLNWHCFEGYSHGLNLTPVLKLLGIYIAFSGPIV